MDTNNVHSTEQFDVNNVILMLTTFIHERVVKLGFQTRKDPQGLNRSYMAHDVVSCIL